MKHQVFSVTHQLQKHRSKGFTIIELLSVIVILALFL
ncbi:prepilin-type N-terminal cleavage/methylation domain-containing protein [Vibrio chagasii]|nr:prepilin-type N-terminal cleavage/methylation domain-containing protein [Vibrio chagasii]